MTLHFNYHPCWCSGDSQSVGSSALVVSRWLWPGNRTLLEVASMVVTWWIVGFFLPNVTWKCLPINLKINLYGPNINFFCTIKQSHVSKQIQSTIQIASISPIDRPFLRALNSLLNDISSLKYLQVSNILWSKYQLVLHYDQSHVSKQMPSTIQIAFILAICKLIQCSMW